MSWLELWDAIFEERPADPTSREVSVQEVLASLITGAKTAWFESYPPTQNGARFLQGLWAAGFDATSHHEIDWFVSEYSLPVPMEWRSEIPFTYRCPDFACGARGHALIIELKTERGSYSARQMEDYLRLARRKLPEVWTDIALLGPHKPGASPAHDNRQRYAELTWYDVVEALPQSFPGDAKSSRLLRFLETDLAGSPAAAAVVPAERPAPRPSTEASIEAAIAHAIRMAPSVAEAARNDTTERGIDVEFSSIDETRRAQRSVQAALERAGFADRVSVWLWQPSSTGLPATPAGQHVGRELRLAPRLKSGSDR